MDIGRWLKAVFSLNDSGGRGRGEIVDEEGLEKLRQVRAAHIQDFVGLVPGNRAAASDLLRSRIGGPVAWPAGEVLPTDANGTPLVFLVQINFNEMPNLSPFPAQGLLQFFVEGDDVLGCEFPSKDQCGFRVVYHQEVANLTSYKQFTEHALGCHPFQNEALLREGILLAPKLGQMKPQLESMHLEELWQGILDRFNKTTWSRYDEEAAQEPGHEIYFGGHPEFTQSDPRINSAYKDLTICILHLSSEDIFMWGDLGMANFFMTEEDLRHCRFEKAVYTWDCS